MPWQEINGRMQEVPPGGLLKPTPMPRKRPFVRDNSYAQSQQILRDRALKRHEEMLAQAGGIMNSYGPLAQRGISNTPVSAPPAAPVQQTASAAPVAPVQSAPLAPVTSNTYLGASQARRPMLHAGTQPPEYHPGQRYDYNMAGYQGKLLPPFLAGGRVPPSPLAPGEYEPFAPGGTFGPPNTQAPYNLMGRPRGVNQQPMPSMGTAGSSLLRARTSTPLVNEASVVNPAGPGAGSLPPIGSQPAPAYSPPIPMQSPGVMGNVDYGAPASAIQPVNATSRREQAAMEGMITGSLPYAGASHHVVKYPAYTPGQIANLREKDLGRERFLGELTQKGGGAQAYHFPVNPAPPPREEYFKQAADLARNGGSFGQMQAQSHTAALNDPQFSAMAKRFPPVPKTETQQSRPSYLGLGEPVQEGVSRKDAIRQNQRQTAQVNLINQAADAGYGSRVDLRTRGLNDKGEPLPPAELAKQQAAEQKNVDSYLAKNRETQQQRQVVRSQIKSLGKQIASYERRGQTPPAALTQKRSLLAAGVKTLGAGNKPGAMTPQKRLQLTDPDPDNQARLRGAVGFNMKDTPATIYNAFGSRYAGLQNEQDRHDMLDAAEAAIDSSDQFRSGWSNYNYEYGKKLRQWINGERKGKTGTPPPAYTAPATAQSNSTDWNNPFQG